MNGYLLDGSTHIGIISPTKSNLRGEWIFYRISNTNKYDFNFKIV